MSAICAPRSLLGTVLGIAIGISVTFVAENNMLVVVLGSLARIGRPGVRALRELRDSAGPTRAPLSYGVQGPPPLGPNRTEEKGDSTWT